MNVLMIISIVVSIDRFYLAGYFLLNSSVDDDVVWCEMVIMRMMMVVMVH